MSASSREQWCLDGWEQVAAEVAAAQGISRGRAAGQLRYGLVLAERLPQFAALFAAGEVDFRVVAAVVFRTELMMDTDALVRLDRWLARTSPCWGRWSHNKIVEVVDFWIQKLKPAAVRVARDVDEGRHIGVGTAAFGVGLYLGRGARPGCAVLRPAPR